MSKHCDWFNFSILIFSNRIESRAKISVLAPFTGSGVYHHPGGISSTDYRYFHFFCDYVKYAGECPHVTYQNCRQNWDRHLCGEEGWVPPRPRDTARCALSVSGQWVHNPPLQTGKVSTVRIPTEERLRVLTSPRCLISYATWTVIKKTKNLLSRNIVRIVRGLADWRVTDGGHSVQQRRKHD